MGSTAHVVVTGGDRAQLLELARRRIVELEDRWSRFRPTSELSRLNATPGRLVLVSADTYALVDRAVTAWRLTAGAFDPSVLPALRAAGYDDDLAAVRRRTDHDDGLAGGASPGCGGVELFPEVSGVVLPVGVELDPGGIGKGLAADLITAELLDAGAAGAMVNLGGDLRVRGAAPAGDAWSLDVEHPSDPDRTLLRLALHDGAVATSSRLRRTWVRNGRTHHHIIDPRTGAPVSNPVVAVTAVAGEG
jgi:thiamine biosynthesis lipoprotein